MRLLVPFALLALLISSSLIPGSTYRAALALQIAFYALSASTFVVPKRVGMWTRVADAAFAFVLANTAAVVAFANFIGGRQVVWNSSSSTMPATSLSRPAVVRSELAEAQLATYSNLRS